LRTVRTNHVIASAIAAARPSQVSGSGRMRVANQ
jgi:hypothetical protein